MSDSTVCVFSSRDIKPDNILLDEHGKILSLLVCKNVEHSTIHVIEIIFLIKYLNTTHFFKYLSYVKDISFTCEGSKENITLKEVR